MVRESKRRNNDIYDAKTYQAIAIRFRVTDDAEILEILSQAKVNGIPYREVLKEWYEAYKEKNPE